MNGIRKPAVIDHGSSEIVLGRVARPLMVLSIAISVTRDGFLDSSEILVPSL